GEGLVGILLAILAVIKVGQNSLADVIAFGNLALGQWGSLILFIGLTYILVRKSFNAKLEE
ncbi:MAG: hypothetical protein LOD89_05780, partial [Tissierellales bacterium]